MSLKSTFSPDRLRFLIRQIKGRLWIRPLVLCLLSIGAIYGASLTDETDLAPLLPEIRLDSVESLLTIMASSMLVIATFAVGSMVAAYASSSTGATPRSFVLVVADDVSQNALSAFVGAFIFSLVSLIAVKNDVFGPAGLFTIFAMTILVFGVVIATFVRWVDRIARLGRVSNTIEKVENATAASLERRRRSPTLGAMPAPPGQALSKGSAVYARTVGYVQHIDMDALQSCAEALDCRVIVAALPGTFVNASRPLLYLEGAPTTEPKGFSDTFKVGRERTFSDDPRFGVLALSEIADKALSSGINDPGTAITIIGVMVRLFTDWQRPLEKDQPSAIEFNRILVPELVIDDLFDDAFTAIARDGAGIVEVTIRLQKALNALAEIDDVAMSAAACRHSRMALTRAERAMLDQNDIDLTRQAATFSQ